MASRRMFANAIVSSARFLRMGASARLLYYDLGMQADDEGIVEAFTVMRTTGASEDDLKLLAEKGFVVILNADLVTYICDWDTNNYIRSDRRQPSIYAGLLAQFRSGEMLPCLCADSQMPVSCQADVSHLPDKCQDRIGKDRIGKDRIDEESAKSPHHAYGQYQNVYLTDEELTALQQEFPNDWQQRIERVSEYAAGSGKAYKNYLAVIRAWAKKDRKPLPQNEAQVPPVYDLEGVFT